MKIKKIIFIIISSLLLSFISYGMGEEQGLEDYYLQINVKNLKDDFFMVKYDGLNEKVYIGLNSFFYFLELYALDIDIKRKKLSGDIDGKDISISFEDGEYVIMENELYVELDILAKKLNFKSTKFSPESLKLVIEPRFELPYEKREKGKIERLRLDLNREEERKKIDIEMPKKIVTPGLVKLEYMQSDLKHSSYNLNFEYASQLMYGEFYMSGGIKPDTEIDYGNLTYSNIIRDNDLVLGSFSLIAPNFLNVDSKTLGISLDNNDTYVTRDGGITIIKGEAINAESIELYRNSFLIDYKNFGDKGFENKNFEFRIDDGVINSNYILKIYYRDGKIEERRVYSLSDTNLLKKGKDRFSLQLGKTDGKGDQQGIGKYFYGVTDNITLGIGGMNLTSVDGEKYKLLENDILFRTGTDKFPLLFQYKNYYDYKNKDNNFEITVEQKIFDYNLQYVMNRYSENSIAEDGIKNYDSISVGKNFGNNFIELGLSKSKKIDEKEDKSIYAMLDSSEFSPFYTSLKVEKTIRGENEKIVYNPYVSYVGNNGFSIMADIRIEKSEEDSDYKGEYSLRANLRRQEIVKNKLYADLGFEIKYKDEYHKPTYGITFDIELDDLIYTKISSDSRIDEKGKHSNRTGVYLNKTIDLSDPKRQISKNISLSNSWVYGKIFLDKNNNGIYDKGEKALSNVGIMADNVLFYSNENGDYIAEGLYSSEAIEFKVDRRTIDPMTKYLKESLRVKTRKSAGMRIDIPINIVSMVAGNIWNTENFSEKEFIQYLTMTTVLLEKDGKVVAEVDPEFDGMFFFEDVPSGEYKIKFKYLGVDEVGFSIPELDVKIELSDTEEGEYFEGFDTTLVKVKNSEDIDNEEEMRWEY